MAEQISGSEEEFVGQMNARAAELGMTNTHFVDCCGLTDAKEHYTSARDVALMSRELLSDFPRLSNIRISGWRTSHMSRQREAVGLL